jgi:hypothetical protein
MEFNSFKFNQDLDIEPAQSDVQRAREDALNKQLDLEDYVVTDGIVLNSPSLEPAIAEDFED